MNLEIGGQKQVSFVMKKLHYLGCRKVDLDSLKIYVVYVTASIWKRYLESNVVDIDIQEKRENGSM